MTFGSLFSLESDDCKAEADSVAEIDESEENEGMKDVKKFTDSSFGGNEEFRALEWSAHSPHCRADLTGQSDGRA